MATNVIVRTVLFMLCAASIALGGGVRYVSISGSSANNGQSQGAAWDLLTANDSLGTGGIDTIKIFTGTYTQDIHQDNSGADSTHLLVYMAASDTSVVTIRGNNGSSDYGLEKQVICQIDGSYVQLHGLHFYTNDYGELPGYVPDYCIKLYGDYVLMDSCSVHSWAARPDIDGWIYEYNDRGVAIYGEHVTVKHCRVRGWHMGIVIAWEDQQAAHATLYRDTITNCLASNVVITGNDASSGAIYSGILIRECVLDTTWEEDCIQFNGDQGTSDSTVGAVLVQNNVLKFAGESSVDIKGAWRTFVEGNTCWNTIGDDDGNKELVGLDDLVYDEEYHGWAGPALQMGLPSRADWWTVHRFNLVYSGAGGSAFSTDGAAYHNTYVNNRRRWNVSQTQTGATTIIPQDYINGWSRNGMLWFANNIVVGMRNTGGLDGSIEGGALMLGPDMNIGGGFSSGNSHIQNLNGNLYYESTDSMASGPRFCAFYDILGEAPWTKYYTPRLGLTAWKAYCDSTIYPTAEDSSVQADPQFVNAPIYATEWDAGYDFRPGTGSAALAAAVALATVKSNSTSVTVDLGLDANLFRHDLEIGHPFRCEFSVTGDSIMIGDDLVRVTGVDYDNGDIVVDHSITVASGDRVYIWRNGGVANYIGAFAGAGTGGGGGTAPTVSTGSATSVTTNSATLNGLVNPNGASTTYKFDYGTTTGYGTSTTETSAGSGTGSVSVSAGIGGLSNGTTYHYRVEATNATGTSYGSDVTFTTGATLPSVPTNIAPANGSTQGQPVTFRWTRPTGATRFWLCVSTDDWNSLAVSNYSITDTQYTVSGLPYETECVWNVAAGNDAGWSSWSTDWNFTTYSAPVPGQTITVNWNRVITAATMAADVEVEMAELQRRDHVLILRNPTGLNVVIWPPEISWPGLETPPQPMAGDTAVYYFVRDSLHVYGFALSSGTTSGTAGVNSSWVMARIAEERKARFVFTIATGGGYGYAGVLQCTANMGIPMSRAGCVLSITTAQSDGTGYADSQSYISTGSSAVGRFAQYDDLSVSIDATGQLVMPRINGTEVTSLNQCSWNDGLATIVTVEVQFDN